MQSPWRNTDKRQDSACNAVSEQTKDEYVRRIWKEGGILLDEKAMTLKSTRKSNVYVNNRNFICSPDNMDLVLTLFQERLSKVELGKYALCNVDSSVSPYLVSGLSQRTRMPMYLYRPVNTERGISMEVFSYDQNPSSTLQSNLPAILIDDVVTTADTIIGTTLSLSQREPRRETWGAVVLVDRRMESEKSRTPTRIVGIVALTEILEYGIKHENLTDKLRKIATDTLEQLRM